MPGPKDSSAQDSNWTEVNGRPKPSKGSGRENRPANGSPADGSAALPQQPPAKGPRRNNSNNSNKAPLDRGTQTTPVNIVCGDMDTLKGLIDRAQAGSGEVARIIAASTFRPREPAYTKLLQQCKHSHSWEKAVELWDVMRATPELKPNTISYSVLIDACAACGRWQESEKYFQEQLEAAKADPECKPNKITYSSLLTAGTRGGRVDRSLHWYRHMVAAGIQPDSIMYGQLIPACLDSKSVLLDEALELMEDMHRSGQCLDDMPEIYSRLIHETGRRGNWQRSLDIFLAAQMAGVPASPEAVVALMGAFEASSQTRPAAQLLEAHAQALGPPDLRVCHAVLRVYAKAGCWQRANTLWERVFRPGKLQADGNIARLVLDSFGKDGDKTKAAALTAEFRALGVLPSKAPST